MYTIDDLNIKLISELREIAENLEVTNYKKLTKEELIYKILDQQALKPSPKTNTIIKPAKKAEEPATFDLDAELGFKIEEPKKRFRRQNVAETTTPKAIIPPVVSNTNDDDKGLETF